MEWLPLEPLTIPGRKAKSLNRRIATHLAFRTEIDTGTPAPKPKPKLKVATSSPFKGQRFKEKNAATIEALRREIFIRRDIGILLTSLKQNTDAATASFKSVHAQLKALQDEEDKEREMIASNLESSNDDA